MNIVQTRVVFDRKHQATATHTGLVQIEVRHNAQRRFLTTGVKVYKNQFKNGRVVGRSDADTLNNRINTMLAEINTHVDSLNARQLTFTLASLDGLNNGYTQNASFLDFMERRIEQRPLGESARKQHRKVLRFLRTEYTNIRLFSDLTTPNIILMDEYLHQRQTPNGTPMMQTSIYGYHKVIKAYINDAIRLEITDRNPYTHFHASKGQHRPRTILTIDEIEKIRNYQTASILQRKVRDLFIVQCYTGLSFADLYTTDFSAVTQIGDNYLLQDTRQKTGTPFVILLLPPVMDILTRYGGTLPRLAYDVYNRNLKVVSALAGVQKHISTHIGRHTFATSVAMASGIPIETVARMLGHKHISTTQIYAKVLPENVLSGYEKIKTNLKEKAVI